MTEPVPVLSTPGCIRRKTSWDYGRNLIYKVDRSVFCYHFNCTALVVHKDDQQLSKNTKSQCCHARATPSKTGFAAELPAKSSFSDFRSDESLYIFKFRFKVMSPIYK